MWNQQRRGKWNSHTRLSRVDLLTGFYLRARIAFLFLQQTIELDRPKSKSASVPSDLLLLKWPPVILLRFFYRSLSAVVKCRLNEKINYTFGLNEIPDGSDPLGFLQTVLLFSLLAGDEGRRKQELSFEIGSTAIKKLFQIGNTTWQLPSSFAKGEKQPLPLDR